MPIQDRYCYRLPQLANVTHFLTPIMYHTDFQITRDQAVDVYLKGKQISHLPDPPNPNF